MNMWARWIRLTNWNRKAGAKRIGYRQLSGTPSVRSRTCTPSEISGNNLAVDNVPDASRPIDHKLYLNVGYLRSFVEGVVPIELMDREMEQLFMSDVMIDL
jgi:hypothetical protein